MEDVQPCVDSLQDILPSRSERYSRVKTDGAQVEATTLDPEEAALGAAIVGKLTVELYSCALDKYLTQATEAEAEAKWLNR